MYVFSDGSRGSPRLGISESNRGAYAGAEADGAPGERAESATKWRGEWLMLGWLPSADRAGIVVVAIAVGVLYVLVGALLVAGSCAR